MGFMAMLWKSLTPEDFSALVRSHEALRTELSVSRRVAEEARKDTERLDWLDENRGGRGRTAEHELEISVTLSASKLNPGDGKILPVHTVRQTIDAARGNPVLAWTLRVRGCRGHFHACDFDQFGNEGEDIALDGDPFPTREACEAAIAEYNAQRASDLFNPRAARTAPPKDAADTRTSQEESND